MLLSCGNLLIKRLAARGPADQLVKPATGLLAKAEHILNGIPVFALERLDGIEAIFNFGEIDRIVLKSRRIALHRAREVVCGGKRGLKGLFDLRRSRIKADQLAHASRKALEFGVSESSESAVSAASSVQTLAMRRALVPTFCLARRISSSPSCKRAASISPT